MIEITNFYIHLKFQYLSINLKIIKNIIFFLIVELINKI